MMSPTLNFCLFSMFMTMHPALQPPIGGAVVSPSVQHWHPWMKKSPLPHIVLSS